MGFRLLLRSPKRHSKRIVFLIDERAKLGAVTQGRSGAPTVRREVSLIAALLLAGDLRLKGATCHGGGPCRRALEGHRSQLEGATHGAHYTVSPRCHVVLSTFRASASSGTTKLRRRRFAHPYGV